MKGGLGPNIQMFLFLSKQNRKIFINLILLISHLLAIKTIQIPFPSIALVPLLPYCATQLWTWKHNQSWYRACTTEIDTSTQDRTMYYHSVIFAVSMPFDSIWTQVCSVQPMCTWFHYSSIYFCALSVCMWLEMKFSIQFGAYVCSIVHT